MPGRLDLRTIFRERLKAVREARGLSQKQLGVKAGLDAFVASTRINRYEMGVHEPDLATIERMAGALGVAAAYFLADSERLARLISEFHSLTDSEKDQILDTLGRFTR